MTNIYARDIPRDLMTRIRKVKKGLGTKTWVSFFYEAIHRLEGELEQEAQLRDLERGRKEQLGEDY